MENHNLLNDNNIFNIEPGLSGTYFIKYEKVT